MNGTKEGAATGATGADAVVQTPDSAQAQADAHAAELASYLLTAREWHRNGSPLEDCARWLLAQNDPKYSDLDSAKAAISQ